MWDDGYDRRDAEFEARGRRGRRGPGPRQGWDERGGERRSVHHHRHDHFSGLAYDDRDDVRGFGRGRGREGSDELAEATRRLVGALRAVARTQDSGQRKAVAIMDETTRTIYRLLSEEPATAATPEPPASPAGGVTA
jgi:hypothetical protein